MMQHGDEIVQFPHKRTTCECERYGKSSVQHRNWCPIKQEAIKRLHLLEDSVYVKGEDYQ